MVTQKIVTRLSNDVLPEIRMVSGDVGREIQLEIYASEDSENPIDLETYSAEITIIKPDNTFIMDNFDGDMYELPEQAGAVSGFGYYQIKIFTSGKRQIYTGQGPFLVDDMILNDDVIESSSIAFGDRFPEDFATKTWVDDEIAAAGTGTYVAGNVPEEETMPPLVKLQINDDIYPLIHKVEEQEDADITNPAEGDVLTYDANDQKWKNEPLVIPDPTVTKTATGNPIEFSDGADAPLVKCVTQITGSQDLHGYDKPWVGGAGVNKFPDSSEETKTSHSITVISDGNGMYSINGTESDGTTAYFAFALSESITATNNQKLYIGGTYIGSVSFMSDSVRVDYWSKGSSGGRLINNLGNLVGNSVNKLRIEVGSGTSHTNETLYILLIDNAITDYSFSPWKNICPITAYTQSTISVEDENEVVQQTSTATFSNSIYQGNADFVGGKARATWGYIASYNGETLPGEWISSMDEYAPGTTPTTGAQVAYELASPTEEPITPTNLPIKSLFGYNHIESSTGDMEVEYITQQWDPIMKAEQLDNMKVYSTEEHVVGKWIDGTTDVYEKTIVSEFTNHAENYTLDLSQMGGNAILPIDISPAVCIFTEGGGTYKQIVQPTTTNQNINNISIYHGGATAETFTGYVTVRYIYL